MKSEANNHGNSQLADTLLPHLYRACEGHLKDVHWFRTDWQRGGAATGRATWQGKDGESHDVMVKFPIRARELLWTRRLQLPEMTSNRSYLICTSKQPNPTICWLVIEWPIWPAGQTLARRSCLENDRSRHPIPSGGRRVRSREGKAVPRTGTPCASIPFEDQEKSHHGGGPVVLAGQAQNNLPPMVDRWRGCRPLDSRRSPSRQRHGRVAAASGDVTLIDLAEVRPGHWVEDAVFLERRLWASPERLEATRPVHTMAKARMARGLPTEKDCEPLADIRRALMAATTPAFMKTEGHPGFLTACRPAGNRLGSASGA